MASRLAQVHPGVWIAVALAGALLAGWASTRDGGYGRAGTFGILDEARVATDEQGTTLLVVQCRFCNFERAYVMDGADLALPAGPVRLRADSVDAWHPTNVTLEGQSLAGFQGPFHLDRAWPLDVAALVAGTSLLAVALGGALARRFGDVVTWTYGACGLAGGALGVVAARAGEGGIFLVLAVALAASTAGVLLALRRRLVLAPAPLAGVALAFFVLDNASAYFPSPPAL